MKRKIYFSESSIIKAGENMRKELSSYSTVRSAYSLAGKNYENKTASELKIAFKKAVEKLR